MVLANLRRNLLNFTVCISLDILTFDLLYVMPCSENKQKRFFQKGRSMNTNLRFITGAAVACAAGLYFTTSSFATTVNLNSVVQNGSFEGGTTGGVPNSWSACCSGSPGVGVYAPTSTNYTAGSDGLASGIVPDGTHVMYVPTSSGNGSGYVVQDLGMGFATNTTYTANVYVAMPLVTAPNNDTGTNHIDNTTITAELLVDNGGSLSLPGTITVNTSYVNAAPSALGISSLGVWELITLSVTTGGSPITGDIGLELGGSTTSIDQPHEVDFDMIAATPLPGAVWLFGTALFGGLGFGSLRKKRQQSATAPVTA
jgi:hypothetical protein